MKKKLWCVLCIMICMMMIDGECRNKKRIPEKKKSEKSRDRKKQNLKTEKVLN